MRILFIPTLDHQGLVNDTQRFMQMLETTEVDVYCGPAIAYLHKEFDTTGKIKDNVVANIVAANYLIMDKRALTYDAYIGLIPKMEYLNFDAVYTTNKEVLSAHFAALDYSMKGIDIPEFFNDTNVTFSGSLEEIFGDIQRRAVNLFRSA